MAPGNRNRQSTAPANKRTRAALNVNRIKLIVATGAVAGTLGGWGVLAHANTDAGYLDVTQASSSLTVASSPLASISPTATGVEESAQMAASAAELTSTPTSPPIASDSATAADTATDTAASPTAPTPTN